jgi:fatty acid desaturase
MYIYLLPNIGFIQVRLLMKSLYAILAEYKAQIFWAHIIITLLLIFMPLIEITSRSPSEITLVHVCIAFVLILTGFCQNIGLIHQLDHTLPRGPKPISNFVAKFMHFLGGLSFTKAKVAHSLHHRYLGTDLDPDRLGYIQTSSPMRRLQYLFFIGPLRGIFAPVDIKSAFRNRWSDEQWESFKHKARSETMLAAFLHCGLLIIFRQYYGIMFLALMTSNVFSNIREMAEHGNSGKAAYVNLRLGPMETLFFSTPGFWFHGYHHAAPSFHYLEIPRESENIPLRDDLPLLNSRSSLKYLFIGR